MKKIISALSLFSVILVSGIVFAGDKVTVCHATGSNTNPYVELNISVNGWNHGHSHHNGDFLGSCDGDGGGGGEA